MLGRLITRFCRDDRGAFAVIFGMIAIVLVAMAGATVDLVTIDQARNRVQIALDSAALALQPKIYDTSIADLKTDALALVEERVDDGIIKVMMTDSDVSKDSENGRLYLQAHVTVPMAFVALLGINQMETVVASQVTRKKLALEVVMVLDNSGSMGNENRMTNLKSAAENATCILLYGKGSTFDVGKKKCKPYDATQDPHTKIGIVPFAYFVNVGADNASKYWIDSGGLNPLSRNNFDDDQNDTTPFNGNVNRISLMSKMQAWRGCVETRKPEYIVDDTTPDLNKPDTLFVPEFAPDEPGNAGRPEYGFNNSYINDTGATCLRVPTVVWTQIKTGCSYAASDRGSYDYAYCSSTTDSYVQTDQAGDVTYPSSAPAQIYDNPQTSESDWYTSTSSGSWWSRNYTNKRIRTISYDYSDREKQEALCKYDGVLGFTKGDNKHEDYTQGPNAACPVSPILPLSDAPNVITGKIESMVADGGTNIGEGAAWGLRVLSPTEPFTEGDAYDSGASKVMIVMTDGENTYWDYNHYHTDIGRYPNMNGTYYYMPYGYLWNSTDAQPRLGRYGIDNESTMPSKMNDLVKDACQNAKDLGIAVYTIGLKPPNETTIKMLKKCATKEDMAYFPDDPTKLNSVFAKIASELSELRIEK